MKNAFSAFLAVFALSAVLVVSTFGTEAKAEETRTIKDMRGRDVTFKADPVKVATIDDGFVEAVMTHLGVVDKVAAIGSWSLKRDYRYEFETIAGLTYEHRGWNTMKLLNPRLDELPCVNSPDGDVINFELLAQVAPDLVILRVGDCAVGEDEPEKIAKTVETIEALGLPLAVVYAPGYFRQAELATIKDEMGVIGDVFGRRDEALKLADYLASTEATIRERTKNVPESEKAKILYLGLNPDLRKQGAAGAVYGIDTPESYIIENVVNAKNAFEGRGYGVPLNVEQIYALNPDAIVLPTYNGYHPPREIYEAPYFSNLAELPAIKNKRVRAMPWTPMNCARRVEYPIDMLIIAKSAYPEKFQDVKVHEFVLKFYQDVYGVDEATAKGLRSTQILDWMEEYDF